MQRARVCYFIPGSPPASSHIARILRDGRAGFDGFSSLRFCGLISRQDRCIFGFPRKFQGELVTSSAQGLLSQSGAYLCGKVSFPGKTFAVSSFASICADVNYSLRRLRVTNPIVGSVARARIFLLTRAQLSFYLFFFRLPHICLRILKRFVRGSLILEIRDCSSPLRDTDPAASTLSIRVSTTCVSWATKATAVKDNGLLSPLLRQHLTLSRRE